MRRGLRLTLACVGAAASILGLAGHAAAATWQPAVSWASWPLNDPFTTVEMAVDPLNGPTMLAANGNDTKLVTSDLRSGAWSAWSQLGAPLASAGAAGGLPFKLSIGANGDMAAVWVACNAAETACTVMAAHRLAGAAWEAPVTVYDPSTDSTTGGPWTIATTTDLQLAVDGNGNATVVWDRVDSTSSKDVVTRALLADDTLTSPTNLGYGYGPLVTASANGYVTIVFEGSSRTASPSEVSSGSLPAAVVMPVPTGEGVLGLASDGTGHASVVVGNSFDDTNGLATLTQDSTYAWGTSIPITGSSDAGVALQAGPFIAEDAAGDRSVFWVPPGTSGDGQGYLADLAAGQTTWSAPLAVADASHTVASAYDPMAIDASGDLVLAWNSPSPDMAGQDVVYARYRPAGGAFDGVTQLGPDGNALFTPPVIDSNGVATVTYAVTAGGDSQSTGAAPSVTVTNPGAQTGTVGTAVNLQIQASDTDSGVLTYGATGLPAGLSINASTGQITGTPTTATPAGQPAQVTVTATDASGPSNSAGFAWTINPSSSTSGGGTGGGTGGGAGGSGSGGSGSGGSGSGGSKPLPPLTPSPGAPQPMTCSTSGSMPDFLGKVWDASLSKLLSVKNVTVIERHPSKPPGGNRQVGEVYSQTPRTGTRIDPCTTLVRIVIYGGPDGLSVADFNTLKTLDNHPLATAQLPPGWKVDYWFDPKAVSVPTIESGGVDLISATQHVLRLHVAMPDSRTDPYYEGTVLGHTSPFNGATNFLSGDFPPPGLDGALTAGTENLFGETAIRGGSPLQTSLIVDTHLVGDALNSSTSDPLSDNLHGTQSIDVVKGAGVLKEGTHFSLSPNRHGDIYVVACDPAKAQPCVPLGLDVIPVAVRSGEFDAVNGYKYSSDGKYAGVASGATGVKPATADIASTSVLGELWSRFTYWLGHGYGSGGESTLSIGAQPAPPALVYIDGNSLSGVKPQEPTATDTPSTRLVYDFSSGLYPLLESASTGLPPGQVYEMHGGKAINLIDGSSHIISAGSANIIAAGGANLQEGEVFGIIAAGGANIIGAGSNNLIPGAGYLDANAFNLTPGAYQINRDPTTGAISATPVKIAGAGSTNIIAAGGANIIAAGGANIIAAGGANIIAAGANNLADGVYNIIAAGSGSIIAAGGANIIAAGGANIIAAGGANLTGYQSLAAALPEAWVSSGAPVTSMIADGLLSTNDLTQVGGRLGPGLSFDIASLTHPGQAVSPSGNIIAAGGANIIAAGGANIIAAGGANLGSNHYAGIVSNNNAGIISNHNAGIIAAGAGNIIAAGGAN